MIKNHFILIPLAGALCVTTAAHASKTVTSPYVKQGVWELESKTGYDIDDEDNIDGGWKEKLSIAYGFTDYWSSEMVAEFGKSGRSGADPETQGITWENKFAFTQPGDYWLDVGLKTEFFYNTAGGPDEIVGKLLLAKDSDKFRHILNLNLSREVGEDSGDDTESSAAWSSRYKFKPEFEPGFEIHSGFGALSGGPSFDEQSHQIGPAFYGKIGSVKYDVGYLFGASDAAPDGSIKAIFVYEF